MLAALLLIASAPLPFARPCPSPVGAWTMRHAGSVYHAVFHADGSYACGLDRSGALWEGAWTMEGRTLRVREWGARRDPDAPYIWEWSARLDPGRLSGAYNRHGQGSFSLTRSK